MRPITVADIVAWTMGDDQIDLDLYDDMIEDATTIITQACHGNAEAVQTLTVIVEDMCNSERTRLLTACATARLTAHPVQLKVIDEVSRFVCDSAVRISTGSGVPVWDSPGLESAADLLTRIGHGE